MTISNESHSANEDKILQLATFNLSGRVLGVDILDVKEICDNIKITPIHHVSQKISGYMNIRGQILLVVDLRTEFGFEPGEIRPSSKVLVFKDTVDESFGILVDSVGEVIEISESQISDRRSNEVNGEIDPIIQEKRKALNNLCNGICAVKDDLILILNSRAVL